MGFLEQFALTLDVLLIALALVWIPLRLCQVIGIGLGGLGQDLTGGGDFDYGGEVDVGGDGSVWDIVDWLVEFLG